MFWHQIKLPWPKNCFTIRYYFIELKPGQTILKKNNPLMLANLISPSFGHFFTTQDFTCENISLRSLIASEMQSDAFCYFGTSSTPSLTVVHILTQYWVRASRFFLWSFCSIRVVSTSQLCFDE